jgi:hypothetical protein
MILCFINCAIHRLITDAIDDRLNSLSIKDDTTLERLIPVPEGIHVLSQLMISTSRVTDFKIDKIISREAINLLKHPDSFRTTLVQIANEVYGAFTKAHTNMERIELQMTPVPDLVNNSIKIIRSRNKMVINKDLPRCLESI